MSAKKPKYYGVILREQALKSFEQNSFLKNFIQTGENQGKFIQCSSISLTEYYLVDVIAHYTYKEKVYSVGLQIHNQDILAVYYEVGSKNLGFLPENNNPPKGRKESDKS